MIVRVFPKNSILRSRTLSHVDSFSQPAPCASQSVTHWTRHESTRGACPKGLRESERPWYSRRIGCACRGTCPTMRPTQKGKHDEDATVLIDHGYRNNSGGDWLHYPQRTQPAACGTSVRARARSGRSRTGSHATDDANDVAVCRWTDAGRPDGSAACGANGPDPVCEA